MKKCLNHSLTTVFLFFLVISVYLAVENQVAHAAYDVKIDARNYEKGWLNLRINMDGAYSGFATPHTFTGLTGAHTFTVPDTDYFGAPFSSWNTRWTNTTITVSSGGTYIAEYYPEAPHDVTIHAWESTRGSLESVSIAMDGVATGFNTPHTFVDLIGTHTFTVPNIDSFGVPFGNWDTGWTSTTISVGGAGGIFTANYYYPPYNATIWSWDSIHGWLDEPITMDGSDTGFATPHTFIGLVGRHTFTVPDIDNFGNLFTDWDTGQTSKTLTVISGGTYTARYYAKVATPTFSPPAGSYSSSQNVELTCSTVGASIRYTTDGSEPSSSSTLYSSSLSISSTTMIKAKAFKSGMTESGTAQATYTITTEPQPNKVSTPTFSPGGGTYTLPQNVVLTCATSGATMRYTVDGSQPSASSAMYSSPISVTASTTVRAKAFVAGMTDSDTASITYIIGTSGKVATPTFSPVGGTYSSVQTVVIQCSTTDAIIRYTTDGSEPSSSSTVCSSSISLDSTTTVKAKAFKAGILDSNTASVTYTISSTSGSTDSDVGLFIPIFAVVALAVAGGAMLLYFKQRRTPSAESS